MSTLDSCDCANEGMRFAFTSLPRFYLHTCTLFLPPSPINGITSRLLQRICFNNPVALCSRPELGRKELLFPQLPFAMRARAFLQLMASFALRYTVSRWRRRRRVLVRTEVTGLKDELSQNGWVINMYFHARWNWVLGLKTLPPQKQDWMVQFPETLTRQWLILKSSDSLKISFLFDGTSEFRVCILINLKLKPRCPIPPQISSPSCAGKRRKSGHHQFLPRPVDRLTEVGSPRFSEVWDRTSRQGAALKSHYRTSSERFAGRL